MDAMPKTLNPNKQLKEEFVSNLTGSSMLEIVALSAIVPILMVLRHWSSSSNLNDISCKKSDDLMIADTSWRSFLAPLAMDFLLVIIPMLSVFTILSDWTYLLAVCLILLLIISILVKRFWSPASPYIKEGISPLAYVRSSISSYRVSMMVVTCLCILAVDFNIYPRRYAKTETYGTGLMDLGVGSFVVANALVSKQARRAISVKWKDVFRSISPLLLLGFGRLIFTSELDYQVHVGEYGVHWNFFFTLAAVSVLTSVFSIHPDCCGVLGSIILIVYQICLSCGLNEYLLSNQRSNNVFSQNKEGLFSIFGYWGMYLISVQLGHYLFFKHIQANQIRSVMWTRIRIWFLTITLWLLTVIFDKFVERVSRRMCNLAYVTLVLAQNFQVLAILMLSDFLPGASTSVLEQAVNHNLLGLFILANVLTGVVNLYVDTLSASPLTSFTILVGYASFLSVFAMTFMSAGIKLKFW